MNFDGLRELIIQRAAATAPQVMGFIEAQTLVDNWIRENYPEFVIRDIRRIYFEDNVIDQSSRIVNASIEFVRFGILPPHKVSGFATEFANSAVLKDYLTKRGVLYEIKTDNRHLAEYHANRLSDWAICNANGIQAAPIPPTPPAELSGMPKRIRYRDMVYISAQDMAQCVILSEPDMDYSVMLMSLVDWINEGYFLGMM